MFDVIRLFYEICLLKKAPQDTPHSAFLLQFSIAIYLGISLLVMHLTMNWWDSFIQTVTDISITLLLVYIVLLIYAKTSRYLQTVTAVIGTDAILSFAALPAFSFASTGRNDNLSLMLIFVLIVWNWVVAGHIFRHALNKHFITGFSIAFLYLLATYQIKSVLFAT